MLLKKGELFLKIFLKNISDYSISTYKELYKGVSIIFKAVQVTATLKINFANIQGVIILVNIYKIS